jgi:glyoxylase-like metal-dependent hydrolase (beta-lactamase superfamily II)
MSAKLSVLTVMLNPEVHDVPLNIVLVQGPEGAVLIDTAKPNHLPDVLAFLKKNRVRKGDLRLILNTHFHGDHIGCNPDLIKEFHCLVAAPALEAPAIEDALTAFVRASPPMTGNPPTEAPSGMVMSPVHIRFVAPFSVNLGGGVVLEALPLPGHTDGSHGFYEQSTQSLILGDAIPIMNMPGFHILDDGLQHRQSLLSIERFLKEHAVKKVITTHHPPMTVEQFAPVLEQSLAFCDQVAAVVRNAQPADDIEHVAHVISEKMGKTYNPAARKAAYAYMKGIARPDAAR